MNRFDNGSVSAYTPQSFQELAFVPLMKRQQHDEMSKNLAELNAIATDPLNEHRERALQLKNDLESKLGNLSGELASRGIDGIGKEAFYKLQKERNDLIAPTGEIGIINAAKVAEAKAKEDFMKNADKSFGQNVLEQKWLEHRQKYADMKGRDKDGNIINISNLGSPKYVDLDTGIRDVLSTLGSTTTEKLLNSGLQFKNTDHGVVMTNAQGSIVTETNDEQLNNALKALKTRFIDKTGEGRISRDFEGRTTNEDLDYINNRVLGAKVFKQNKDYKTTYDMLNPPKGSGDGEDGDINEFGITEASNNFLSDKYSEKNYSDIQNIIDKNKNSNTPEGKQSYYEATTFKNKLDKSLKNNSEYVNLVKQKDQLLNKLNIPNEIKEKIKKTENGISTLFHDTGVGTTSMLIDGKKIFLKRDDLNKIQKYEDNLNKIFSKKSEIIKNTIAKNNVESTDYKLTAFTPKQQSILKIANENIQSLFQTNPENIKSYVNIEALGIDGNLRHSLSTTDIEKISKVLANAKDGDIKLQTVSGKGFSGKPEYVLRVIPNDESEGIGDGFAWMSKDKIKDKPIDIRVSFKQNTNNTNVDNVNDLITNKYLPLAGDKGKNLSTTMKAYARYGNQSYKDYKNDPIILDRIDNLIENEVIKDNNSPYANLTDKQARERYLKHHGDELIDFHDN